MDYPASAFLYVPDSKKPSTWKLRYKEYVNGKLQVTAKILGAAAAAFSSGGFRGNKVQLPDSVKASIKARIRSLYRSIGVKKEDIPSHLNEQETVTISETFESRFDFNIEIKEGSTVVEKETGIIRNLPILGLKSKNGHTYMEEAVRKVFDAKLYEGAPCYKNHKDGAREYDDAMGTWVNTRYDENTKMGRADLIPLAKHKEDIIDLVENHPTLICPSHVVDGKVVTRNIGGKNRKFVEHIDRVHSVDLVAGAATVNSMREQFEEQKEMDWKELTIDQIKENRADLYELMVKPETSDNNTDQDEQIKKLLESNKALNEKLEKAESERERAKKEKEDAEKLAESHRLLEAALKESTLPEKAKERIKADHKEVILTEEKAKALVKNYIDFITEDCGVKLDEAEVKIPTDRTPPEEELTLGEAINKRLGLLDEKKK